MGTPEFAVHSLKALINKGIDVVAVVTTPDKPAGRGQKISQSDIKQYAVSQNLTIFQPEKLKDNLFIEQLQELNADLFVVVAFRMLPEIVWNMPPMGTINLHASLLPDYRGAAPINWAIINGETKTGVTTFFIEKEIDTGKIIHKQEVEISNTDNAGNLHDKLAEVGANLLVKTVLDIKSDNYQLIEQNKLIDNSKEIKFAPKLFKQNCEINWNRNCVEIYNFIRGLNPYPSAHCEMISRENKDMITIKIFDTEYIIENHNYHFGKVFTDNKKYIKITALDGFIYIKTLQLAGKKRLNIEEFLRGFNISSYLITEPMHFNSN